MRGIYRDYKSQGMGMGGVGVWVNNAIGPNLHGSQSHQQRMLRECTVMGLGQCTPMEQQLGRYYHENDQTTYRGKRATSHIHTQLWCEKMYPLAPMTLLSSWPRMNYNGKVCPWERVGLLLRATAFEEAEDIGFVGTKKGRLKRALWESPRSHVSQTTGKGGYAQMSPRRWQENGVQRRWKEERGLLTGCWDTGCTVFLRAGEEFWSHWKGASVVWAG